MKCYFRDFFWRRPVEAGGIWYRGCYTNIYFNLRFPMPEGFHRLEQTERGPILNRMIQKYPVGEVAAFATRYGEEFSLAGPSGKAVFFVSIEDGPEYSPLSELFVPEGWEKAKRERTEKILLGDVEFSLERARFLGGQFHLYCGRVGNHAFQLLCVLEDGEEAGEEYGKVLGAFDRAVYLSPPQGEREVPDDKMKEALQKEYRNLWMASKIGLEPEEEGKEPLPPKEEYHFVSLILP